MPRRRRSLPTDTDKYSEDVQHEAQSPLTFAKTLQPGSHIPYHRSSVTLATTSLRYPVQGHEKAIPCETRWALRLLLVLVM
jgi:hypothetical protein